MDPSPRNLSIAATMLLLATVGIGSTLAQPKPVSSVTESYNLGRWVAYGQTTYDRSSPGVVKATIAVREGTEWKDSRFRVKGVR